MRLDMQSSEAYVNSISIHAPLTGCDFNSSGTVIFSNISIHAPLTGCDRWCSQMQFSRHRFQSTHPLRDATQSKHRIFHVMQFQSTHPLRDATRHSGSIIWLHQISIHAPLTGCDSKKSKIIT